MVSSEIRLIIFFAANDGEALYSQQKQDQELTVAKIMNSLLPNFRLKLKKVGKTTRPFRYGLNHNYTVEVKIDSRDYWIDRVPKKLQMEVRDIVQEAGINTIHKQRNT